MANVAIQGIIRDSGGTPISGAYYQGLFFRVAAGSSATQWKGTVKQTGATGQFSFNLGDNDWIGVPGISQPTDRVIIAVWVGGTNTRAATDKTALAFYVLTLTSETTYAGINVTCSNNIAPVTSFSIPSPIRRDTPYSIGNNSSDDFNIDSNHFQRRYYSTEEVFPCINIDRVEWTINGTPQSNLTGQQNASINLSFGSYTLTFRAFDLLGAQGNLATYNFNVTYRPPVAGLSWLPVQPTIIQVATFTPSITDIDGRVGVGGTGVDYLVGGVPVQTGLTRIQEWTYQFSSNGAKTVRQSIRWQNGFSVETVFQDFTVTVANIPPTATVNRVAQSVESVQVEWSANASDLDGTVVQYDWRLYFHNGPDWDLIDESLNHPPSIVYLHAFTQSGEYKVTLTVTDNNGATFLVEDTVTIVITPVGIGGGEMGPGSIPMYVRITDGLDPIEGVGVWISTDAGGLNVIAGTLYTTAFGIATFLLDAGTYYVWKQLSHWNFTNPETMTVNVSATQNYVGTPAAAQAVTQEAICSSALLSIGDDKIQSMADTSVRGQVVSQKFQFVLDALLREYLWNFSIRRVSLSPDLDLLGVPIPPAFGYSYQFSIPADLVRTVRMSNEYEPFRVEGTKFVSNATVLNLLYVSRVNDPSYWDATFREAFIARLAYEICIPLAGNEALAKTLYAVYKDKLRTARLADGQEGTPEILSSTTLTREVRG